MGGSRKRDQLKAPFKRLFNRSSSSIDTISVPGAADLAAQSAQVLTPTPNLPASLPSKSLHITPTTPGSSSITASITPTLTPTITNTTNTTTTSTGLATVSCLLAAPSASVASNLPVLKTPSNTTSRPISPVDYSNSLWKQAYDRLSSEDKQKLNLDQYGDHHHEILNVIMEDTRQKKEICEKEKWTFSWKGETIILSDVADKAITWIGRFIQVGDTIVQYDPVHSALPWAGIAVNNSQTMGAVFIGIEKVSKLLVRCRLYEELYIRADPKPEAHSSLEKELTELYAAILNFLIRGGNCLQRGISGGIMSGFLDVGELKELLDSIDKHVSTISETARLAEAQCQRFDNRKIIGKIGDVGGGVEELKAMLERFDGPILRMDSTIDTMYKIMEDEKRQKILKWLSKIEYIQHHEEAQNGILEGTGDWLLAKEDFKSWQDSSASRILWLHGIPGAGKTKLTSMVAHRLVEERKQNPNHEPIAYFYCNRNEPDRQDPVKILSTIVKQLVVPSLGLPEPIISKFSERERQSSLRPLRLEESCDLILELASIHPKTTIVIDALDETDLGTRRTLLDALKTIVARSKRLVKIFVSSRDDGDITLRLQDVPNLYIEATDSKEDIKRFVQREVARAIDVQFLLGGKVPEKLRQRIESTLLEQAQGMFQWVDLQIKSLCEFDFQVDIEENLGKLPETLEATYLQIHTKINSQKGHGKELATKALMWLMCFRNPPQPDEWVTAVSSAISYSSSEIKDITVERLLKLCHNLVTLDRQLNVMRFVHLSVREFFEKNCFPASKTNLMAVDCCLSFLESPTHWLSHLEMTDSLPITGFHVYVIKNWTFHARNCYGEDAGHQLYRLRGFLESQSYSEWVQLCEDFIYRHIYRDYELESILRHLRSEPLNPLFASCYLGIEETFKKQWDSGTLDRQSINEAGETLLFVACTQGHESIVQMLLQQGVDINAGRSLLVDNPLMAAVKKGNLQVTRTLLDRGASFDANGSSYNNLLDAAAAVGTTEIVQLVLNNYGGEITGSIVESAVSNPEHGKEVTEFFLEMDETIVFTERIFLAAWGNHQCGTQIIEFFINRDPKFRATKRMLSYADGGILGLLLARDKNINVTEAIMTQIARQEKKEIMEAILSRGNPIAITEEVLLAAASNYHNSGMFKFVLGHCESTMITEAVLCQAVTTIPGEEMISLLRGKNRTIKITESLFVAAAGYWDSKPLIKFFLGSDNSIEATEAVMIAAAKHGKEVIESLLAQGRNISITPAVIIAAAGSPHGKGSIEAFLERDGNTEINESVIVEAAKSSNKETLEFLLTRRSTIKITEAIMVEAAREKEVLKFLLARSGDVEITEAVLASAACMTDKEVVELLLGRAGDIDITKRVLVAAIHNRDDAVMKHLLSYTKVNITEDILVEAAQGRHLMILKLLLEASQVPVTESVLIAVTNNWRKKHWLRFLLSRCDGIKITECVLIALVNSGTEYTIQYALSRADKTEAIGTVLVAAVKSGRPTIEFVLARLGNFETSEDLLVAAAQNLTKATMGVFLSKSIDIVVTEEILSGAASNPTGSGVLELLLNIGDTPEITEAVLVAAARNPDKQAVELLLDRCHNIGVTEEALVAAAYNEEIGVIELLLSRSGGTEVTEAVLVAAAQGGSKKVFKLLLDKSGNIDITEAVWAGAVRANLEVVKFLLDREDNVSISQPILLAATYGRGYEGILNLLMRRGARFEINEINEVLVERLPWKSTSGEKLMGHLLKGSINITTGAFRAAIYIGNTDLIDKLLESGYTIPLDRDIRLSCLQAAIEGGQATIIRTLIYPGNDMPETDEHGWTPYMVAVQSGREKMAEMFKKSSHYCGVKPIHPERWGYSLFPTAIILSYDGKGLEYSGTEAFIKANHPFPPAAYGISYFEVNIRNQLELSIQIGVCGEYIAKHRFGNQFSWVYSSWGSLFCEGLRSGATPYYTRHDIIVGCGVDWERKCIFFTLDGLLSGTIFSNNLQRRLYPFIYFDGGEGPGTIYTRANFSGPFKYKLPAITDRG